MAYFVNSIEDGTIDIDTLSAQECEVVMEEISRREEAAKRSLAERKKKVAALAPPHKLTLQGKAVFLEPDVQIGQLQLQQLQRTHGWRKVGPVGYARVGCGCLVSFGEGRHEHITSVG
jgi:hypothetical protein